MEINVNIIAPEPTRAERGSCMSSENTYEAFFKVLRKAGGAIPVIHNDELFSLLRELLTPEEAGFASFLPPRKAVTAGELAEELKEDPDDVQAHLERMTDNGVLHAKKNKTGQYRYSVLPLLPGIFEAQFYRGTKTDRDYRVARCFRDYLDVLNRLRDSLPEPLPAPATSYFRVLPVEEEIETNKVVYPYASLSKFVEEAGAIAVGTCFCRHHAILVDEKDDCGASHKNCMAFGDSAVFVSERHNGRLVEKKEALEILKKAEEEGLVHCSANTSEELVFICNCCSCHCGILGTARRASHASEILTSGYIALVDPELCSACETCTDRCPVSAISMDEAAIVDAEQCIGCSLCVSTCPTGAIGLMAKPGTKIPPKTLPDLEAAMRRK